MQRRDVRARRRLHLRHVETPPPLSSPPSEVAPVTPAPVTRLVRVLAPAPDFLPPLDGEAAMLLHLLDQAFTELIEGA